MARQPTNARILEALIDFRDGVADNFAAVHKKLVEHDRRFDEHDRRFDEHDRRLDMIDRRIGRLETRIEHIEQRLPA